MRNGEKRKLEVEDCNGDEVRGTEGGIVGVGVDTVPDIKERKNQSWEN